MTKAEAEKLKADVEAKLCKDCFVCEIGDKKTNKIVYKFRKRTDKRAKK